MVERAFLPGLAAMLAAACATGGAGTAGTGSAGGAAGASAASSGTGGGGAPCTTSCDGGCVDTSTDGASCGSCGHGCLGGDCMGGACQPVVAASGQASPQPVVAAGGFVYWGNLMGGLARAGRAGGDPEVLVAGARVFDLAVDASSVYWVTSGSPGSVLSAPVAGGPRVTLATGQDSPASLARSGAFVYWVNDTAPMGSVDRVTATPGGTPSLLVNSVTHPHRIAVDAASAYWTQHTGEVMSVALGGGLPSAIAVGQDEPYGIAVDAENVYWTTKGGGTVMQRAIAGGPPITIASAQGGPVGVAVDAARVYWTASLDGKVLSAPIGGGAPPVVLASGQGTPWGIAVDDLGIYWTDPASGDVMKLAK